MGRVLHNFRAQGLSHKLGAIAGKLRAVCRDGFLASKSTPIFNCCGDAEVVRVVESANEPKIVYKWGLPARRERVDDLLRPEWGELGVDPNGEDAV